MKEARLLYVSDVRYYSWKGVFYTDKGFPLEYLVRSFETSGAKLACWTFFGRLDYCFPPPGSFPIDCSICNVAFAGPRTNGRGISNYVQCIPSYLKQLYRSLRKHNVLLINANFVAGWLCLAFPWLLRSRITISHSIGYAEQIVVKNKVKQSILRGIATAMIRRVHRSCQINVFVSKGLKINYGNNKRTSMIVNDSSILMHHIVLPQMLRNKPFSPPRVLYVGRLCPEKGVFTLISAIAQLNIPVELIVAGDGPQKQDLQKQVMHLGINNIVHFLGVVPWGEKLFNLMQNADILVVPSTAEGLGLVLIEAMANGLVPIASAVGGIPDIVKDGVNGLLVEPLNVKQLCQSIEYILGNDMLRSQMQLAGLQVAAENTIEKQRGRLYRDLGALARSIENS